MGCLCLKWSEAKVAQSCPTLCDPMDHRVHGILQARMLEWVAFPFSKGSSQPRDGAQVSLIVGGFSTSWAVYAWETNTEFAYWSLKPASIVGHWDWIMFLPRDSLCVSCSLLIHTHRPQLLNTQLSTCSLSKMKIHSNTFPLARLGLRLQ